MGEGRRVAVKKETVKNKKKKSNKLLIFLLLVVIIGAGVLFAMKFLDKGVEPVAQNNEEQQPLSEEPKQVQIFKGNKRPIAVMIDNNTNAWPHSGLEKAYLVYEIIVEGGETRLMALFKGQDVDKIGPIRSSRHYFLDYALENDAIYTHFGWSPQAKSQISSLGVNNINGMYYDSGRSRTDTSKFWRQSTKYAPHNAYTSTEVLLGIAKEQGYRTTSDKESVLNYVTDEVNLEDGINATDISIPYNGANNVIQYKYDKEKKVYTKYSKSRKQVSEGTGKSLTVKNIIITFAGNDPLNDGSGKGRQDLHNIGTLNGYYITNGKAIKIKCIKKSRKEQTVYKDYAGNEIKVNDGNTYIQICPLDSKVKIKPGTKPATETNTTNATNSI